MLDNYENEFVHEVNRAESPDVEPSWPRSPTLTAPVSGTVDPSFAASVRPSFNCTPSERVTDRVAPQYKPWASAADLRMVACRTENGSARFVRIIGS